MSLLDGAKLRALRQERGLTTRDVADALGMGECGRVAKWESGWEPARSLYLLWRLAKVLDVALDELLRYPLAYGRGEYGAPLPPTNSSRCSRPAALWERAPAGRTIRRNAIWYRRHGQPGRATKIGIGGSK